MPKARSLTGRTEQVRRWKIYVDGRVEDPHGHIHQELPLDIAYCATAVDLAMQGKLEVDGLTAKAVEQTPVQEPPALAPEVEEPGFRKPKRR